MGISSPFWLIASTSVLDLLGNLGCISLKRITHARHFISPAFVFCLLIF
uniref:Uncharacterized protein n=1 Tax=Rhizophora mucronata TaxID=61149 RepID=A0A2P2P0E6_RHIMU